MGQRQLFTSAVIPSSFGREQSSSRGSFFKGDNFGRFMGDTFARGGSFHTFRLIRPDQSEYVISKREPHFMGDRLFVTPADGSSIGPQVDERQTVTTTKINTNNTTTPTTKLRQTLFRGLLFLYSKQHCRACFNVQ